MRLSKRIQLNPEVIDSSLQKLNCVSQNIVEIDIHPTVLSILTSVAPDEVRGVVAKLPLQKDGKATVGRCAIGMNTALAFSLRTVLLSRNHLTTTLGLVQFKNVVRLSLLGNRIQRIEDCEALCLLPTLQFLSLEFNPVTSLPHYRAHILRICAWPDSLNPKNCRLRKLDAQSVSSAEVERAAQCLQREKVTMGELVHRMRFLALLTEAKKRIALHHELRRKGVLLKDTVLRLTVENVVVRCSAQVLYFVDINAASHLVRRLMTGKCRMCAVDLQCSFVDDVSEETEMSRLTTFTGLSSSTTNVFSLQNPFQDSLKIFCKDWSKDVFSRAIASLDRRICELLLTIAHALGEELTVVDVDHLNKLWFTQVAKADEYQSHKLQNNKVSCTVDEKLPTFVRKDNTPSHKMRVPKEKLLLGEIVRIALSPSDTSLKSLPEKERHDEYDTYSLGDISPISQQIFPAGNEVEKGNSQQSASYAPEFLTPTQLGSVSASDAYDHPDAVPNGMLENGPRDGEETHELLPTAQALFFPPYKDSLQEQKMIGKLRRYVLQNVLRRWRAKAWQVKQETLCENFVRERFKRLLQLSTLSLHDIFSILQLLPRTDRKRVLFQFWLKRAKMSYAPRSFCLMRLFARWCRHTHWHQITGIVYANRRARILAAIWLRWHDMLHKRLAKSSNHLKKAAISVEGLIDDGIPAATQPCVKNGFGHILAGNDESLSKKSQQYTLQNGYSPTGAATDSVQGFACSTKPSVDVVDSASRDFCSGPTDTLFTHLSMPTVTPNVGSSPLPQLFSRCEKATQTLAQSLSSYSSYEDLAKDYRNAVCADAKKAVEAMQVDRLRLVDRLIALEQRANAELVRAQHYEVEIKDLRQKLAVMTLREECMNSTLADKQRETDHLRAVIQALREERRELLRPGL